MDGGGRCRDVLQAMTERNEQSQAFEAPSREAANWLMLMTSGEATTGDVQALNAWRARSGKHAEAFAETARLWQLIGPAVEAVAEIEATGPGWTRVRRLVSRRAFLAGACAASGAAVVAGTVHPPFGLWPSASDLAADYRTGTGEQRHLALGDGVSLELNTATSVNVRGSDEGREIDLISGEVAVAAQAPTQIPVTVLASGGRTSASDSAFNIRRVGEKVRVTCVAGVVQVGYGGRMTTVRQHQQITYDDDGMAGAVDADPTLVTAWQKGMLIFRNEPLAQVIDEVNRYRRGRIILLNSALGERLVTARFKLDRLDEVVTQVQQVFGAQLRSLPGEIILVS